MTRIVSMVVVAQAKDYPQKVKDDTKRILIECVNMLVKETDPNTINQLVYKELKKKKLESIRS